MRQDHTVSLMILVIRCVMIDAPHKKDQGHSQYQHYRQEIEYVVKGHHGRLPDNLIVYSGKTTMTAYSRFQAPLLQGL